MRRRWFLVLGAAETVVGLTNAFHPVPNHRGLYAPNPNAGKAGLSGKIAAVGGTRVATLAGAR